MYIRQKSSLDYNAFVLAGSLAFISFCVNPFIYAARYEVFRRYVKQLVNKSVVNPSNTGSMTATTRAPAVGVQH